MILEVFKSFDFIHILVISITVILCALTIIFTSKIKLKYFEKIVFIIGVVTEVIKVFSYILFNEERLGGFLPKTDLPFHLCSIQIILFAILNFSKNEKLKKLIYGFMIPTCLIGGFAAILLPTVSAKNHLIIFIQFFTYHIAIVLFACYLLKTKEVKFTIKDYFNTLKMLAVVGLFAIYINSILYDGEGSKINFMYVVNPPTDNLPILNKDHGWLVYIISYALVAIFAVTLCYIKPIIVAIKERFKKKDENEEKCIE